MGLATRPGAGKGRKNGTVKALMPSCYTGRQEGIRANLTAVSMEEVRCRALFLALFTPMLTTLGNVPRLRARSAHSVSHLPVSCAKQQQTLVSGTLVCVPRTALTTAGP